MMEPGTSAFGDFTEQDLKATLTHALRWVGILGALVGNRRCCSWWARQWQQRGCMSQNG